jgi:hypothetical protein
MVWDAISYARKIQLMHLPGNLSAAPYRDEVLTPHMLHAKNLRREVLQHDNARPHRRIRSCAILPHSYSRACCISCIVCSAGLRLRTRRSKSSHKCSIGFKSGDLDDQGALPTRGPYFGAVQRCRHRLSRVQWCNRVRSWDLQNGGRVWFSDESRFMLQKRDGRTRGRYSSETRDI